MGRLGLDPIRIADLERSLSDAAARLTSSMAATRRASLHLAWDGPDQQRFVRQVEGLRRDSDLAAHRLRLAVRVLAAHRSEQEAASAPAATTAPSSTSAATGPARTGPAVERARRVQTFEVGLAVPVRVAEVGAALDLRATTRILTDGAAEVEVAVGGELSAGVGLGHHVTASGVGGGAASATYRFGSRVEADRFIEGLRRELVPRLGLVDVASGLASPIGLVAAGGRAAQVALGQVSAYLGRYATRRTSTTRGVEGGLRIEAGAAGTGGAASAAVGRSVTERPDGPSSHSVHVTAAVEAEGVGLDVDGRTQLSLREDSDGRRYLVATTDLDALGALRPVLSAAGGVDLGAPAAGVGTSVSMTLELTDETGDMVDAILHRPASLRDPSRLAALVEGADVVVQRHEVRSSTVGVDVDVLRAEGATVTATATATWIKPPHGDLVEVEVR